MKTNRGRNDENPLAQRLTAIGKKTLNVLRDFSEAYTCITGIKNNLHSSVEKNPSAIARCIRYNL